MATKTIADKPLLKPGTTFWSPNRRRLDIIGALPDGARLVEAPGDASMALVFADAAAPLRETLDAHAASLRGLATIWVAYPKGNRTDINRDSLWPILAEYGMRPNGQVAIDETWSALRFRPLKEGEAPFTGGGKEMEFQARVQLDGKTATGIEVPAEVVAALGQGKRPAVRVTINGYTYRSTIASMGGEYKLPVSAEVRAGAGIATGEDVTVEVEPDTAPREVAVPPALAAALAADESLRATFDALSHSKKRQIVEPIVAAKTDETRQRRVEKAVESLS